MAHPVGLGRGRGLGVRALHARRRLCGPAVASLALPGPPLLLPAARPQLGRPVNDYIRCANDEVTLLVQVGEVAWVQVGAPVRWLAVGIELAAPQPGAWPSPQPASELTAAAPLAQVETAACYRDLEASVYWWRGCCAHAGCVYQAGRPVTPRCLAAQAVLSVPGVDCAFMGPVDLSHALGLAQRLGFPACFDSPEFAVRGREAGRARGRGGQTRRQGQGRLEWRRSPLRLERCAGRATPSPCRRWCSGWWGCAATRALCPATLP